MGQQIKPDMPTLIKRIIQEASLPQSEQGPVYKLNRQQLAELYLYVLENKKTITELKEKIKELNNSKDSSNAEEK